MASFFIAYESVSGNGSLANFEAAVSSMGEALTVHDSLLLLKTSLDGTEIFDKLMVAAGENVRLVCIPANASASLMNVRPGVIEAFHRFIDG